MRYYNTEQDMIDFAIEFTELLNKIPRGVMWTEIETVIQNTFNEYPSEDRRNIVINGEKAYESLRKKYTKCLQELEEGDSAEEVSEDNSN